MASHKNYTEGVSYDLNYERADGDRPLYKGNLRPFSTKEERNQCCFNIFSYSFLNDSKESLQRMTSLAASQSHVALIISYSGLATFILQFLQKLYEKKYPSFLFGKQVVTCILNM